MVDIANAKILILASDGFEESELFVPLEKLRATGATVDVAGPEKTREPGKLTAWAGQDDKPDWGRTVDVTKTIPSASAGDYDALVLPGGVINPDNLRVDKTALQLIRSFYESGKVVAAICHAPWLLVEAGVVKGRKVTSYHSIRTDVINAGGQFADEPVVTDNGLVTSRKPDDLDAFVAKIIEEIREGRHAPRQIAA
ncbi:type 1 glutamine amidotransferase domain-containing protein [Chthonobacter rhizosphaerae]|uniref:type 1 glutamine amidotransferase domain-containing protein n=1 Tax=Chthonobacter rhizosphaerae TaxID=2735553 RepID=UPI0015EFB25E|nr:type 1 glutamine amidotransferase domain-containing protein [Chthonobacter rhizosphaerae]